MDKREMNGAEKACHAVGGQAELSKRLSVFGKKISPQGISWWCQKTKAVPAHWAASVAAITGLSLHELNPKDFPTNTGL